jgi:hypothetical protein
MKNKYYLLIIVVLVFFTLGATTGTKDFKEYRISTSTHQMNGQVWVFETKYNVLTGNIISRKQVHSKKYRNVK